MQIWIDADACQVKVKELIFKTSLRLSVKVTLVANSPMYFRKTSLIDLVVVSKNFDATDHHIVQHSLAGDIVISTDILLASSLVDKGVCVINPYGTVYTKENVKEAVTVRNLSQELREGGLIYGGRPPYGPKDFEQFANAFDRELTKLLKR